MPDSQPPTGTAIARISHIRRRREKKAHIGPVLLGVVPGTFPGGTVRLGRAPTGRTAEIRTRASRG
ncbi:hypothetical protein GCM10017577_41190 [Pseudonocardia halophobica]|uniref:Uncharacterized protein n=1 Tax=Pseudonocardia halophobica TaxID=29401 RepID=A0A9W6L3G2_9PSEU|nr:hypothetical protein GCM10017577_41190 [Pseudonocardia halophobica]